MIYDNYDNGSLYGVSANSGGASGGDCSRDIVGYKGLVIWA